MKARWTILTLMVAGSCSSTTEPLTGDIFVLESINGVVLPAPYTANGLSPHRIVADTLALGANGAGERRTASDDGSASPTVRLDRILFTYTRSASGIAITYRCNDTNADCLPAPTLSGTITEGSITINQSLVSRQPLAYRRLFPPD